MELTQKACSGTEDEVVEGIDESKKSCTICKTTKTPMWRVGPLGPKSLCNACGIKYTKMTKTTTKKGENFSSSPTRSKSPKKLSRSKSPIIKTVQQRKKKRDKPGFSSGSPDDSGSGNGDTSKDSDPKKRHSMQLMTKKQRSRRKFGEVERAAVLLLSLSWGSVSA